MTREGCGVGVRCPPTHPTQRTMIARPRGYTLWGQRSSVGVRFLCDVSSTIMEGVVRGFVRDLFGGVQVFRYELDITDGSLQI